MKAPSAPTSGDKLDLNALNGALLYIKPLGLTEMDTSFGPATAVKATIVILDGPHKGDTHDDALIFPRVLVSQLRNDIGQTVVARLGKGEAKPGKSAPWLLTNPSQDDLTTAKKYEAHAAKQAAAVEEPF